MPPADCQIALTLAAIHTTTDLLSQTMVNIATYPEMFTALREEVIRVLSKHGLKKAALADLKLMDSFLKETQRMKPILIGE
jgi:cytochrome P450